MVLTKSKGPKVQSESGPFLSFYLFLICVGEESESAPGFGLTHLLESVTFRLRTDRGALYGHLMCYTGFYTMLSLLSFSFT